MTSLCLNIKAVFSPWDLQVCLSGPENPKHLCQVYVGDDVTIPCSSYGVSPPSATWSRPYMALPIKRSRVTAVALLISKVQRNDNGVYICKATNFMGENVDNRPVLVPSKRILVCQYG